MLYSTITHDLATRYFWLLLRWQLWHRSRDRTELFAKLASADGGRDRRSKNPRQSNPIEHDTGSKEYEHRQPRPSSEKTPLLEMIPALPSFLVCKKRKKRYNSRLSMGLGCGMTVSIVGRSVARWIGILIGCYVDSSVQ